MTETNLTFAKLLFCYNTLQKRREEMASFDIGTHVGYLEAGLVTYGYLETYQANGISEINCEMKPATKWWKKPKRETREEAIVRMTQKMFKENDVNYE